jgi:hypothetical protein
MGGTSSSETNPVTQKKSWTWRHGDEAVKILNFIKFY